MILIDMNEDYEDSDDFDFDENDFDDNIDY